MKPPYLLALLVIFLFSCKKEEAAKYGDGPFKYIYRSDFQDPVKTIELRNGSQVILGRADNTPSILIVDDNYNEIGYRKFNKYKNGAFIDLVECEDGTLVAVGRTRAEQLGGDLDTMFGLTVRLSPTGDLLNESIVKAGNKCQWLGVIEDDNNNIVRVGESETEHLLPSYVSAPVWGRLSADFSNDEIIVHPPDTIKGFNYDSDVIQLPSGDYLSLGMANRVYAYYLCLTRRDKNGELISRIYLDRLAGSDYNSFYASTQLPHEIIQVSGGYIIGKMSYEGETIHTIIRKYDPDFNLIWSIPLTGLGKSELGSVKLISNDLIVTGTTYYAGGYAVPYVASLNPADGSVNWEFHEGAQGRVHVAFSTRFKNNVYEVTSCSKSTFTNYATFMFFNLDNKGELITN